VKATGLTEYLPIDNARSRVDLELDLERPELSGRDIVTMDGGVDVHQLRQA
jgi:hypothetical protein